MDDRLFDLNKRRQLEKNQQQKEMDELNIEGVSMLCTTQILRGLENKLGADLAACEDDL